MWKEEKQICQAYSASEDFRELQYRGYNLINTEICNQELENRAISI